MMRTRKTKWWMSILCVGLLIAGCGVGEVETDATEPAAQTTTSTTIGATTTTLATTTSTDAETFDVISDLVYLDGDDRFVDAQEVMDVLIPAGDGPWPVVVVFHGDPHFAGKDWSMPMASALAERGRVVFVPDWGHTSTQWQTEGSLAQQFDSLVEELRCSVVFAKARATQYGGNPDHITVMGYSAGGNAALMAALSDIEPLPGCVEPGPGVEPQAVVSAEGDVLIGAPSWDRQFEADPEAFYSLAPWRDLDPADSFPVYILAADTTSFATERRLGSDPYESIIVTRHTDIDLVAELNAMGLLDDGVFSLLDSQEWAYQTLLDAGYDTTYVLLPDTEHAMLGQPQWAMSDEAWELTIETVINAER